MDAFWVILLGIIQGLTEFLPISSSGHLVITQSLIPGFTQPGIIFDVVLHAGTLFAVVIYFWDKLIKIDRKYIKLLVIGTIPAAFFGLVFQDIIEGAFTSIKVVGAALIFTSLVNLGTDKIMVKKIPLSGKSAFLIGLAQAVAIVPGISRSGSTIFAGVYQGLGRKKAAEFSFLLSVPAVMGANLLQFATHVGDAQINFSIYIFGFLSAAISGFFAIKLVISLLSLRKFKLFSIYCFLLGAAVLIYF